MHVVSRMVEAFLVELEYLKGSKSVISFILLLLLIKDTKSVNEIDL